MKANDREKVIIKVSVQGIIVNVLLVIFKAIVGFIAGSIAVILDAVNNLSDAISQVVTIVATKLAAKEPDKKHPYGYGRVEYLSSVVIAAFILVAGITSLKESFVKAIHPTAADYSTVSIVIISVAVVVKFVFGRYVKAKGEKVASNALIASGTDAIMDSILSLSTLVAAVISIVWNITLEGILGIILSCFIIKAGFEILKDTLSSIIGDRTDSELSQEIKAYVRTFDKVNGAYDLILHDYGPSRSIGSIHIEVDDMMNAKEIHTLTRNVSAGIYNKFGIIVTVGIYAKNTTDEGNLAIENDVKAMAAELEYIKQLHGFYLNTSKKHMTFDIVVNHHAPSSVEVAEELKKKILEKYSGYGCDVQIDHDFSD